MSTVETLKQVPQYLIDELLDLQDASNRNIPLASTFLQDFIRETYQSKYTTRDVIKALKESCTDETFSKRMAVVIWNERGWNGKTKLKLGLKQDLLDLLDLIVNFPGASSWLDNGKVDLAILEILQRYYNGSSDFLDIANDVLDGDVGTEIYHRIVKAIEQWK